ncbi:MAG: Bcr/CflA family drug resistance efflux transporter [Alphaproteobacteria bacterium RIFOXYD12_FULL_60_8]|nr:MAG: Bcr/CflA family drug resistance efflux transporter [Alphaproteobacteria bacterium RIFOXYD12_FULL_60_8]
MDGRRPQPSFGLAVLLTSLVAFGPMSTDMYLPSLPDLTTIFQTSVARVQLSLSFFVGGFALSQLFYGPLSDRFGRRPVLLGGLTLYCLATAGCLWAASIEELIAGRFFQALGGGAGAVVGRAIVRDVWGRDGAARMFAYLSSAMALAPLMAPFLGGALHAAFGWQANFLVLVGFGLFVLVVAGVTLKESNAEPDVLALNPRRMVGNYFFLLKDRTFRGYALAAASSFGGLFAFISGSSFTLIDVLGLRPETFGFGFGVAVGGYILGAFGGGRLSHRLNVKTKVRLGVMIGLIAGCLGAGLAWSGVEGLAAVLGPICLYFVGSGLVMPNSMAGAVGPFPQMAGAASALIGFMQLSVGAVAGAAVGLLFDGTTRPMPTVIAVMAGLAFLSYWLVVARTNPERE